MATMSPASATNRYNAKARPLMRSYWVMPAVSAVVVLAIAAGMLTETLILANHIDSSVTPIKSEVTDIRVHTDNISNLTTVDQSAKGIRSAADPLSGQASSILSTVGTIDATVGQIDNATGSISAHAGAISSTVDSIAPHVLLIALPVESIARGLNATIGELNTVLSLASGIKGDTGALLSQPLLPSIQAHAHSICGKLLSTSCTP